MQLILVTQAGEAGGRLQLGNGNSLYLFRHVTIEQLSATGNQVTYQVSWPPCLHNVYVPREHVRKCLKHHVNIR